MKRIEKAFSILFALCLTLALLPTLFALTANVGDTFAAGGLRYKVLTANTVEVIGPSDGAIKNLSIPASVSDSGVT